MKLYKLTDEKFQTKNNTQWGEGITHSVTAVPDPQLCSKDVLHAYTSINLALLLNPVHADLNPTTLCLFEAKGEIVIQDWGKVGCAELTTTTKLQLPAWFTDVTIRMQVCVTFANLCARAEAEAAAVADAVWSAERAAEAAAAARVTLEAAAWTVARVAAAVAVWTAEVATTRIDFGALADQAVTEVLNEN